MTQLNKQDVINISEEIIEKVIKDLEDRKGLKHIWEQIDSSIQEEIKDTWKGIIFKKLIFIV